MKMNVYPTTHRKALARGLDAPTGDYIERLERILQRRTNVLKLYKKFGYFLKKAIVLFIMLFL